MWPAERTGEVDLMMLEKYILSVPYDMAPLDFAATLSDVEGVRVSRSGPARRVQVWSDDSKLTEIRSRLPARSRVERVVEHSHRSAGAV
jgi:hypothetical protein